MALSILSWLKPRGVVVGGRSLLRIGSSMTKRQSVLSNLLPSSSSSSSSSSSMTTVLSSSYDQSSSFPQNTYALVAFGIAIGGSSINNDDGNNQTTLMAPSDESSGASFISIEMIGAAAKIFRNSSPQQCTLAEALEYAGVPREFAITRVCTSRLTREIGIINAQYGLPQFNLTKDVFKERYKAIFDSIPLSVSIENKHG